ncbi:unnamed protein product [Closterium sp. NIES-54]
MSHAETTTHKAAGVTGSCSDAAAIAVGHLRNLHAELQSYRHQSHRRHYHHSHRCLHRRHQNPHPCHQSHHRHHLHRLHYLYCCPHHHSRCPLHHPCHPCPCCCGASH